MTLKYNAVTVDKQTILDGIQGGPKK